MLTYAVIQYRYIEQIFQIPLEKISKSYGGIEASGVEGLEVFNENLIILWGNKTM